MTQIYFSAVLQIVPATILYFFEVYAGHFGDMFKYEDYPFFFFQCEDYLVHIFLLQLEINVLLMFAKAFYPDRLLIRSSRILTLNVLLCLATHIISFTQHWIPDSI